MPIYRDNAGVIIDPFAPKPKQEPQKQMASTFVDGEISILAAQGIGDSVWTLTKAQAIAEAHGARVIRIVVNTSMNEVDEKHVEFRALNFLRRFDFVSDVRYAHVSILKPQWLNDEERYNYIDDGTRFVRERIDFSCIPNATIERGGRLEDCLPEYATNFRVMDHFQFKHGELRAVDDFKREHGEYAVFYLGPESGNTREGHNRGTIWTPQDWARLGAFVESLGLRVVVTGAPYDRAYWEKYVKPIAPETWIDRIGADDIAQTFAFLRGSRFCVAYQSGVGIVAQYLGVPTIIFWRQAGSSMSPNFNIRVDESMSTAWVSQESLDAGRYIGAFYGRDTADSLAQEIVNRNW